MAGRKLDPAKRAQILRAATDVFSAREFHTVPVEDVAAVAGVGKGTLYLYFPTKEQLFYATILEALDVLIAELGAATDGRRGEEGLRAFVSCMLDFFWRRRHLAVLMHRYEHKLREPEGDAWRTRRAAIVARARAIIEPAGRPGRSASETTLTTEMLLALIRAAILNHQDSDRSERAAALIVDLFLHGVGGARPGAGGRAGKAVRAAGGRA